MALGQCQPRPTERGPRASQQAFGCARSGARAASACLAVASATACAAATPGEPHHVLDKLNA
eukprot:scaffold3045_cov225-Prasinococcus_capsulatus_cf.AAC.2